MTPKAVAWIKRVRCSRRHVPPTPSTEEMIAA
jgi:hypothetical protein